jgi:hypothetical protein
MRFLNITVVDPDREPRDRDSLALFYRRHHGAESDLTWTHHVPGGEAITLSALN